MRFKKGAAVIILDSNVTDYCFRVATVEHGDHDPARYYIDVKVADGFDDGLYSQLVEPDKLINHSNLAELLLCS